MEKKFIVGDCYFPIRNDRQLHECKIMRNPVAKANSEDGTTVFDFMSYTDQILKHMSFKNA